jgi:hypothetical protein
MADVKNNHLCLWARSLKILSMTSPDLSPLLAVARTRDIAVLPSRPRSSRPQSSWPFRTIRRPRI